MSQSKYQKTKMYQKPLSISFDAEFNGSNPGTNSMLSLGAAIFEDGNICPIATFYIKMKPQPNTKEDPKTMRDFWSHHPDKWAEIQTDNVEPAEGMKQFSDFLKANSRGSKFAFVASPSCVDWMFLKVYYEVYGPEDKYDIGFYCHDLSQKIRTYMETVGITNEEEFKKSLAPVDCENDHHALHDAIYQGVIFINFKMLVRQTKLQQTRRSNYSAAYYDYSGKPCSHNYISNVHPFATLIN
jgi:3' exoribonuclease, RNase T-like